MFCKCMTRCPCERHVQGKIINSYSPPFPPSFPGGLTVYIPVTFSLTFPLL